MEKIVTLYVSSGKESGEPTKTKLAIDYSNLTDAMIREYATDSLVIKWRAKYKNSKKAFPAEDVYVAPIPGTRSAPVMSEDEMIAKLAATMTPDQIVAAVKARLEIK